MSLSSEPKQNNPKRRGFKINVGHNTPAMQTKPVNSQMHIQMKPQIELTNAERNERLEKELSKITDPDLVCDLDEKEGGPSAGKEYPSERRAHQTTSLGRFMSNLSQDYFNKNKQESTMFNLEQIINQLHKKHDSS